MKQEVIALKAVVRSGSWQGVLNKYKKSGEQLTVESRWTLMFDGDGQPKSILIVDTDITDKKQLEEQFLRTQRLESIGTLACGIAHDSKNISNAAQALPPNILADGEQQIQIGDGKLIFGPDIGQCRTKSNNNVS